MALIKKKYDEIQQRQVRILIKEARNLSIPFCKEPSKPVVSYSVGKTETVVEPSQEHRAPRATNVRYDHEGVVRIAFDTKLSLTVVDNGFTIGTLSIKLNKLNRGLKVNKWYSLKPSGQGEILIEMVALNFGKIAKPEKRKQAEPVQLNQGEFLQTMRPVVATPDTTTSTDKKKAKKKYILKEFNKKNIRRELPHIAAGHFGIVYRGTVKNRKERVAIKDIKVTDYSLFEEWKREVDFMSQHPNPYVVEVYGFCCSSKMLTIVMEYMENGTLYNLLHGDKDAHHMKLGGLSGLNMLDRLRMGRQVSIALAFLHANKILHRDVKSLNILVNDDRVCKLSDFGSAKLVNLEQAEHYTADVGTPLWMAPEVRAGKPYSLSADVYSMGVVLYEIFENRLPDYNHHEQLIHIPSFSFSGGLLVESMLNLNPNQRPTSQLVAHQLDKVLQLVIDVCNSGKETVTEALGASPVLEDEKLQPRNNASASTATSSSTTNTTTNNANSGMNTTNGQGREGSVLSRSGSGTSQGKPLSVAGGSTGNISPTGGGTSNTGNNTGTVSNPANLNFGATMNSSMLAKETQKINKIVREALNEVFKNTLISPEEKKDDKRLPQATSNSSTSSSGLGVSGNRIPNDRSYSLQRGKEYDKLGLIPGNWPPTKYTATPGGADVDIDIDIGFSGGITSTSIISHQVLGGPATNTISVLNPTDISNNLTHLDQITIDNHNGKTALPTPSKSSPTKNQSSAAWLNILDDEEGGVEILLDSTIEREDRENRVVSNEDFTNNHYDLMLQEKENSSKLAAQVQTQKLLENVENHKAKASTGSGGFNTSTPRSTRNEEDEDEDDEDEDEDDEDEEDVDNEVDGDDNILTMEDLLDITASLLFKKPYLSRRPSNTSQPTTIVNGSNNNNVTPPTTNTAQLSTKQAPAPKPSITPSAITTNPHQYPVPPTMTGGSVIYDFAPENEGELAVKANDKIKVVRIKGEWAECLTDDLRHGWVPLTYVEMASNHN